MLMKAHADQFMALTAAAALLNAAYEVLRHAQLTNREPRASVAMGLVDMATNVLGANLSDNQKAELALGCTELGKGNRYSSRSRFHVVAMQLQSAAYGLTQT